MLELPDLAGLSNHRLVGKGVCIHCGVPMLGTKLTYPRCDACNAGYRELYRKRIEAGLCPRCHEPLADGFRVCERHLSQKRRGTAIAPKSARSVPTIRWGFLKLHESHERIVTDADKLIADLYAMSGNPEDDELILEYVFEAEADRAEALETLFTESGWTPAEYEDAASDTMVLGDGRVVKKLVGVTLKRVG